MESKHYLVLAILCSSFFEQHAWVDRNWYLTRYYLLPVVPSQLGIS